MMLLNFLVVNAMWNMKDDVARFIDVIRRNIYIEKI